MQSFIRNRRESLVGLAALAAALFLAAPTAQAYDVGQSGFDYTTKNGWGGGYSYQTSITRNMSGSIRDRAVAFAAASLYAYSWGSQPAAAAIAYAERTSSGAKRGRLQVQMVGYTIEDSTFTTELDPIILTSWGPSVSKDFSILGVTFDTEAWAGGVLGARGIKPIFSGNLVGAAVEPFINVGATGTVSASSSVAGVEASGFFDLADLSLPSTLMVDITSGFYYANTNMDLALAAGGFRLRGWVLFITQDFVNFNFPALFSDSWNILSESGYI